MRAISIQSRVAFGHVGNSAAVPALNALDVETVALDTVRLSHHPGHGPPAGGPTDPGLLAAMLDDVERVGGLDGVAGLLSGYLATPANGAVVLEAEQRLRRRRANMLYLCDPVMGDHPKGLYVDAALPTFFRDWAVARADIVTPNAFELEQLLGGDPGGDMAEKAAALRTRLRPDGPSAVLLTSGGLDHADQDAALLATAEGVWRLPFPRRQRVYHGCGDVLAALLLGHTMSGVDVLEASKRALTGLVAVLEESDRRSVVDGGTVDMALVPALDSLRAPGSTIIPEPVQSGIAHC